MKMAYPFKNCKKKAYLYGQVFKRHYQSLMLGYEIIKFFDTGIFNYSLTNLYFFLFVLEEHPMKYTL